MSESLSVAGRAQTAEERRLRVVKTVVLSLACVVGLSLLTALVFGVVNLVTDRPAKEMFLGR
jgi:hypothetical protein